MRIKLLMTPNWITNPSKIAGFFLSSTSSNIIKILLKLFTKLRANTNLKNKFLPIVGSLHILKALHVGTRHSAL